MHCERQTILIELFEAVLSKETRMLRKTTVRRSVIDDKRVVYRVLWFAEFISINAAGDIK